VDGIGTLKIPGNLTFAASSDCFMEISKAGNVGDRLQVIGTVAYAGVLTVTNLAGALGPGDSFQLFSASNRIGAFTTLSLPALAAGYAWTNRLLLDGSIAVVALPITPPQLHFIMTESNTLRFDWTNFAANFRLQAQTNSLATGLGTNWFEYPGGTGPPVNVSMRSLPGAVFFRLIAP
jgi:hypothetical protein